MAAPGPTPARVYACLVMRGSGVRVPASASEKRAGSSEARVNRVDALGRAARRGAYGATVAAQLDEVDLIMFTGSRSTGRKAVRPRACPEPCPDLG